MGTVTRLYLGNIEQYGYKIKMVTYSTFPLEDGWVVLIIILQKRIKNKYTLRFTWTNNCNEF